jgi:polyferredoxin
MGKPESGGQDDTDHLEVFAMIAPEAARRSSTSKRETITTTVKVISFLGLLYAAFGYVNQIYLHWVDSFWLSTYSDKIAIVAFGIWRVARERDSYTRKRIGILTFFTATLWILFPYLTGSNFFNQHLIGTFWFFAYVVIVFSFGRRADCSWNCPCAGIRDTAGHAFRGETLKGSWYWKLRHLKWLPLASLLVYLLLTLVFAGSSFTGGYVNVYWTITNGLYFASFLVIPWTGNRNYCRFLCPYGALYGALNKLGFYKIVADRGKCVPCDLCESACDMGIPIKALAQKGGEFSVADCVGCGRCITACPRGALGFVDIRDYVGVVIRHGMTPRAKDGPPTESS